MITDSSSAWFPNSEICGSKLICSSPQLIAACHVLRRLLMPRHSPCALLCLNFSLLLSVCLSFANNLFTMKKLFSYHVAIGNISFSLAKCDSLNRKKYSDAVLTVFQVRTHSCTVLCFFVSWFACSFEHAAKL